MVLDNEQQRGLIMQIINAAPVSGPYQDIKGIISALDELAACVMSAEVAAPDPAPVQTGGS